MSTTDKAAFDPLDMRNYSLEKFKEIKAGPIMQNLKLIGVPLAILAFLFFELQWCGTIELFETQTKVPAAHCYSAMGIFVASLILWLTEAIPNYLTSLLVVVVVIITGVMKMRPAFAMMGEPVMILNIASFILASALVTTGLAKRISLVLVLRTKNHLTMLFLCFVALNLIFGAFISATSAKTALLLPLFMVISAIYGATGGVRRNNVGRNMVLLNLLANNVSASAFLTGSAANLLAAAMLEKAGALVTYQDWFIALFPLAVVQCLIAWWTGTRLIFPISKEDRKPKLEGGMERLWEEYKKLGPIKISEIKAGIVFLTVLALWSTGKWTGLRAEVVALAGACAVLMPSFSRLPAIGVMKWNDADIPWHMLMFSFGAYVLGGMMDQTDIVGLYVHKAFDHWNIDPAGTGKLIVFAVLSGVFAITTLVSESKTARTIILFPIIIAIAEKYNWDLVGFCLPMAFMINQVYVLYFNSKPANISYLTDQYSTGDSFKYGMIQLVLIWIVLILWTHYVMPLMGFHSQLW
ncbi:Putative malate transporter YflS [Saezia sanguinis]|uniref:Malate transporter YflS n=1 Tax=Saezia sanguinis TaxID=1965230 RepID=A0A433SFW7_9BURK|nr:SLC13 family permease [Saezia sanguinis]RUS67647.1 Putative malate transporter YflS [Saezia sanguinis]